MFDQKSISMMVNTPVLIVRVYTLTEISRTMMMNKFTPGTMILKEIILYLNLFKWSFFNDTYLYNKKKIKFISMKLFANELSSFLV